MGCSSGHPPPEAPIPSAVTRRIIVDEITGEVVEDENTEFWENEQWFAEPTEQLGPCKVIYVYDHHYVKSLDIIKKQVKIAHDSFVLKPTILLDYT